MPSPDERKRQLPAKGGGRALDSSLLNRVGVNEGSAYMHPASRLGDVAREAPLGNLAQTAIERKRKQKLGLMGLGAQGRGMGRSRLMETGELINEGI